jgi:fatty acid desaturase
MRTTKLRFEWHALNALLLPVLVGGAIFTGNAHYFKRMASRSPRWFRQFLVEATVYVVWLLTFLRLDPVNWLLTIVLPHQYAAWGIMAMNMFQHDGCDERSEWNHSRNFVGPVINFFCFNNGYHTIHHRHPGLHWSLAPEAHRREVAPHIHPQLEVPNFTVWFVRTFLLPGGRLTYDGRPVVLGPPTPDEDWVASVDDAPDELGAVS